VTPQPAPPRRATLSFSLGLSSLLLGPLTGLPALVLGLRGLRELRNGGSSMGGRARILTGIGLGSLGTFLGSILLLLTAREVLWPAAGRRVDRIFRDIQQERFYERQYGIWPVLREILPDSVYQAAETRWPASPSYSSGTVSGWAWPGPSGNLIHRYNLQDSVEPVIAMRKPAVPHLFKWVRHQDWYVRYAAIYALERITSLKPRANYHDQTDPDRTRELAIQEWQKWFDEQK
jgi:hypothetical protein